MLPVALGLLIAVAPAAAQERLTRLTLEEAVRALEKVPGIVDLGLYRGGITKVQQMSAPGEVDVYCNIHPQMVGFVMVVDSPFAALTERDGSFRFEGVPAGTWTLKAWHEEGTETSVPLTVPLAGNAPLTISIDTTAFRPVPHRNKYGKEYPPQSGSDDERY